MSNLNAARQMLARLAQYSVASVHWLLLARSGGLRDSVSSHSKPAIPAHPNRSLHRRKSVFARILKDWPPVKPFLHARSRPEIDQVCLATAIGQPLKVPALLDPKDGGWTQLPIVWDFVTRKAVDKAPPMEADPAIPTLREGNAMHVAPPYYPEAALAARAYGICKLHVTVSDAGDVDALEITQSAGSVELDQACLDAIYDAPFIPGHREGKFVSGTTDVVLDWRLPEVVTPANQRSHLSTCQVRACPDL